MRVLIYQGRAEAPDRTPVHGRASSSSDGKRNGMDRLFAGDTVNAAQSGDGPPLFLFHSLLSDRASFDAITPTLSRSFRVLVPELPGFGRSPAVAGDLGAVAEVRDLHARSDGSHDIPELLP